MVFIVSRISLEDGRDCQQLLSCQGGSITCFRFASFGGCLDFLLGFLSVLKAPKDSRMTRDADRRFSCGKSHINWGFCPR